MAGPAAASWATRTQEPYDNAVPVTPSDTVDLPDGVCNALYIGTSGYVKITAADGGVAEFKAVPVGILKVRARRVWATATGSIATDMVALY